MMVTMEVIAQFTAPFPSYLSPVAKVDRMMPIKLRNEACKRLVPTGARVRSFGKIASVRNLAIVYFADESFQNPEQADRLLAAPIAASSEFGERATSGELTVALGDRESGASRPLLNTTEELHYL